MDILTNKSTKQYDTLSRYSSFYTYYNTEDRKYMYGLISNLDNSTEYSLYKITQFDTLESIALKCYGRPDYYWIIAMYNNIIDVFEDITDRESIKVPNISNIKFKERVR